jgi:hypothetical protein
MIEVAPSAVYLLCLATSVGCAVLLVRAYLSTRTALLFWTALGFIFLALNNFALFADRVMFPDIDFWIYRQGAAVIAIAVMLYGFLSEMRE